MSDRARIAELEQVVDACRESLRRFAALETERDLLAARVEMLRERARRGLESPDTLDTLVALENITHGTITDDEVRAWLARKGER